MTNPYKVTLFRAEQLQKLRNVRIHSPSIIQVMTGSKRLFWKDSSLDLSHIQLLLCDASVSLSFENLPQKGRFLSRVFSFHCLPTDTMIEVSRNNSREDQPPILGPDQALQDTLNTLFLFESQSMSKETHTFWVMGLYQQLAERGVLHQLFVSSTTTLTQKLSRYLSQSPGDDHALEGVVKSFAMSRATMIRKLKQEGTQYREVLAEVRLNHALYLMQNGDYNTTMLAQLCGYQSEGRFSQRFKSKFGLTPSDYMKTVSAQ